MNELENIHNLRIFMDEVSVKGRIENIAYSNALIYLDKKYIELGGEEEHEKQLEKSKIK